MLMARRRSISASRSRKVRRSAAAAARPAVDFPEPGNPTRMRWGFEGSAISAAETGCDVRKVGIVVAPKLGEGVAAELLDERVGDHQRGHRLRDDSHRGDGGDVAALGRGFGRRGRLRVYLS